METLKECLDILSQEIQSMMAARKNAFVAETSFHYIRALAAMKPYLFEGVWFKEAILHNGKTHQIVFE